MPSFSLSNLEELCITVTTELEMEQEMMKPFLLILVKSMPESIEFGLLSPSTHMVTSLMMFVVPTAESMIQRPTKNSLELTSLKTKTTSQTATSSQTSTETEPDGPSKQWATSPKVLAMPLQFNSTAQRSCTTTSTTSRSSSLIRTADRSQDTEMREREMLFNRMGAVAMFFEDIYEKDKKIALINSI